MLARVFRHLANYYYGSGRSLLLSSMEHFMKTLGAGVPSSSVHWYIHPMVMCSGI
jgi:hypothetical protein